MQIVRLKLAAFADELGGIISSGIIRFLFRFRERYDYENLKKCLGQQNRRMKVPSQN